MLITRQIEVTESVVTLATGSSLTLYGLTEVVIDQYGRTQRLDHDIADRDRSRVAELAEAMMH